MANDDLLVYVNPDPNSPTNVNGGVYKLPRSVYTNSQYRMNEVEEAGPMALLSFGTVLADITSDFTGLGGMCYLINLPAIQPPDISPVAQRRPTLTSTQILRTVKRMLVNRQPSVPGTIDQRISDELFRIVENYNPDKSAGDKLKPEKLHTEKVEKPL